jgi:RNA polymerase sigma factor (sigma-70 family)
MENPADKSTDRHYAQILRFVRRRTTSAQDAEDLTQDVYEAAARAIRELRISEGPQLAWLYTVAQRRLISHWRQHHSETSYMDADVPDLSSTEDVVYTRESIAIVTDALRRMPEGCRSVVMLKLLEGRSFAEISQ